jgi:alginate O-acetyltransferase complex protein AlgI
MRLHGLDSICRPNGVIMVFSSIVFLFYFLPLFLVMFVLSGCSKYVLLTFSIVFYAWGEPIFAPLILVMIVANYWLGRAIERGHADRTARLWVAIGIVANLLPLGFFKYGAFLAHNLASVAGLAHVKWLAALFDHSLPHGLPLPLGISFYTFHSLSYLIDVYRGDVRAERSARDLAIYISMFPQLIAGPIIRYKTIAGELHKPVINTARTALGIQFFVIGLSQKVLIANTVGTSTDAIFALPLEQLSWADAWLGIICYTLQIYYDFGGYSNMAIGLGLMIGFTYPTNFNYPYVSASMTEFWRRWHISLSSWFRDYLYFPLGGNRISQARTYLNLWIVFLLCGLWHGAAWNFVVWGAAHGCFLVLERAGFSRVLERMPSTLRHVYVMLAVMATWVLFRADSLCAATYYLETMAGFNTELTNPAPVHRFLGADVMLAIVAGIIASGPYGNDMLSRVGEVLRIRQLHLGQLAGLAALFGLVTLSLAAGAYNPFIYFRF